MRVGNHHAVRVDDEARAHALQRHARHRPRPLEAAEELVERVVLVVIAAGTRISTKRHLRLRRDDLCRGYVDHRAFVRVDNDGEVGERLRRAARRLRARLLRRGSRARRGYVDARRRRARLDRLLLGATAGE